MDEGSGVVVMQVEVGELEVVTFSQALLFPLHPLQSTYGLT